MPINSVLHTNEQSIQRVLQTGLPVALVFWRADAAQSAELDPLLDALAAKYAGRSLIAKVDAATEKALVARYAVQLLPTVVLLKSQQVVATLSGRVADGALRAWMGYLVEGGAQPPAASGPGVPVAADKPLHVNGKNHQNATQGATATPRPTAPRATTEAGGEPVTVTDGNFQEIISGPGPVLVDFWAAWCGPCRAVAPTVHQLAQEFAGRALVAKLNVDENPQTARRYNIMGIPALLIFQNGQVVDQIMGAQPIHVLREKLAHFAA